MNQKIPLYGNSQSISEDKDESKKLDITKVKRIYIKISTKVGITKYQ